MNLQADFDQPKTGFLLSRLFRYNFPFFLYWVSWTLSFVGDQFYFVALPWLVLQHTGSAIAVGTVLMTAAVPRGALMLFGGVFTDRLSPRRIMISTTSARAFFVALIAILLLLRQFRIWQLYVVSFGFGVADAFGFPAGQKYIPSLIDPEDLTASNALFSGSARTVQILGPALAGILIAKLGMTTAFAIDASSFLLLIVALWRLPEMNQQPESCAPAGTSLLREMFQGLGYAYCDTKLRSCLLLIVVVTLCTSGPVEIGLAYLAKKSFGSATAYALMISSAALGGLLGSALVGLWRTIDRGFTIIFGSIACSIAVGILGTMKDLAIIVVLLFVFGCARAVIDIHTLSWVQGRVKPELRGRVMSAVVLAWVGVAPISLLLAGLLITWNLRWMFMSAAGILLMTASYLGFSGKLRSLD